MRYSINELTFDTRKFFSKYHVLIFTPAQSDAGGVKNKCFGVSNYRSHNELPPSDVSINFVREI